VEIREYRELDGSSPFGEWRGRLDAGPRQRVTTAILRVGLGNFSNVKGVGAGVFVQDQFWSRLPSIFW
jgi:putative component of toxin-antitoxin plasmid stabilization module